jgi:mRNA deadenylase 3'-5' endonuclease subunit Ccr4
MTGQVNCNACGMAHAFYECPSLPGMDKDAHHPYFHSKALEKHNSKHHQHVSQIHVDDECGDGEEYDEDAPAMQSMDTTNWTNEDWLDHQSAAWN